MKEVSFSKVEFKAVSPAERELCPLEEAQKHCLGTVWRRGLSGLGSTHSGFEFGCLFPCLFLDVSVTFGQVACRSEGFHWPWIDSFTLKFSVFHGSELAKHRDKSVNVLKETTSGFWLRYHLQCCNLNIVHTVMFYSQQKMRGSQNGLGWEGS